jgi:hypothetical protein
MGVMRDKYSTCWDTLELYWISASINSVCDVREVWIGV